MMKRIPSWSLFVFAALLGPVRASLSASLSLADMSSCRPSTRNLARPRDQISSLSPQDLRRTVSIRGGVFGRGGKKKELSPKSSLSLANVKLPPITPTTASLALATLAAGALAFRYRGVLFNKEHIQGEALRILRSLRPDDYEATGPISRSSLRILVVYACGMALWEMVGLSTIPVETAAGMVFGWNIFYASLAGKLLGAVSAFALGRGLLQSWARSKLQSNNMFELLSSPNSVHSPRATAFLMKFSCFPEFVKNFGSSLLPIDMSMFATATLLHGGFFTLLWTWWGIETAQQLEDSSLSMSLGLRITLILAGIVGVVVSPLLMAWWIRDLNRQRKPRK